MSPQLTPIARIARWLSRPKKCGNCKTELAAGVHGYCCPECELEDQERRAW